MDGRTIGWSTVTAWREIQRFFGFSAPQAIFFQKVIKINDFFMNILFSWVYVINFVSNIFMIMKNSKSGQKF